jgi:23S rRNA pseudouridine2605 synthase
VIREQLGELIAPELLPTGDHVASPSPPPGRRPGASGRPRPANPLADARKKPSRIKAAEAARAEAERKDAKPRRGEGRDERRGEPRQGREPRPFAKRTPVGADSGGARKPCMAPKPESFVEEHRKGPKQRRGEGRDERWGESRRGRKPRPFAKRTPGDGDGDVFGRARKPRGGPEPERFGEEHGKGPKPRRGKGQDERWGEPRPFAKRTPADGDVSGRERRGPKPERFDEEHRKGPKPGPRRREGPPQGKPGLKPHRPAKPGGRPPRPGGRPKGGRG